MRDITLEDTFYLDFTTRAFATGIPTVLADTPALSVLEENNVTPITAGVSVSVDRAGVVGLNMATIVATAANGYDNLKGYSLYISTGTVGGVSVVGEKVGEFTIGKEKAKADAALVDINIDHWMKVAMVDGDVTNDSGLAQLVDRGATANYTNYNPTEDAMRALSEKIGSIGTVTGSGFPYAVDGDNTLRDTIDNAAAVNKGGGLVGIPVTGHGFVADKEITIAGSTNYNNAYTIVSQTTNEVVITETYIAETFTGSETIVSSIEGVIFVGTQTLTFTATEAEDGTTHDILHDSNVIDIVYSISIDGGQRATDVELKGFVNSANDNILIQAFDFAGSDWETRGTLVGQGGSSNKTVAPKLLAKHTGTGANLGKIYIRLIADAGASSPTLKTDELFVDASGIGQTVGYALSRIWTNTLSGTAGTVAYTHGVGDNPSLLWADTLTLSASVGLTDFHVINGSTIQLTANSDNFSLFGNNWTLDLNGQSAAGAHFQGALVSGVMTGATLSEFVDCLISTASLQKAVCNGCSFDGTVTFTLAGDYRIIDCQSGIAGAGGPTFTKTAGQAITAEFRRWAGTITMSGIESGDTITIGGTLGTVTLNGADGTVEIRGTYKAIVDNRTGSPTLNLDGAILAADVAAILDDTGTSGVLLAATATSAQLVDDVFDEALSGHQTQGTAGAAITMTAYLGPHGPGVYLDDGAANTGTTLGDDGTVENPVSTIAAATTIAANLGVQVFYLRNDTQITLAQTYEGYVFVGLGLNNKVTLGSQDVDNTEFHNVMLTGTQGGTGQLYAIGCSLTALASAEIIARLCWLIGNNTLRAATTHIFKDGCSAVAGDATPDLTFPGSGTTEVSFRHYSGGLTVKSGTANDIISFEGDGQLIVDATCTSLTVRPRGNFKITDNGTTTNIELEAVPNLTNINAEVDSALNTAIPGAPTADSVNERLATLDDDWADGGRLDLLLDAIPTTAMRGTDNAALASVATEARLAELDAANIPADLAAVLVDTGTSIPALIAALNDIAAADVLAAGDIDGFTLEEALKLTLAGAAGKLSGAATTTNVIRAADDTKARITSTVDSDGNRTAVTLDVTG